MRRGRDLLEGALPGGGQTLVRNTGGQPSPSFSSGGGHKAAGAGTEELDAKAGGPDERGGQALTAARRYWDALREEEHPTRASVQEVQQTSWAKSNRSNTWSGAEA